MLYDSLFLSFSSSDSSGEFFQVAPQEMYMPPSHPLLRKSSLSYAFVTVQLVHEWNITFLLVCRQVSLCHQTSSSCKFSLCRSIISYTNCASFFGYKVDFSSVTSLIHYTVKKSFFLRFCNVYFFYQVWFISEDHSYVCFKKFHILT